MRGRTTEGLIDERNRPTTNPTRTQHNHPTTIFWPRKPSKPRWREGRRTQQQQSPRTNRPFTETSFLPMKHYTHQLRFDSIRFDSIRFDLIPRRIILDSTVYDFVIGIAYHRNRVEEGPAAGEVFPPCGEDQIPTFLFGMISSTRYGDGESTQFLSSLLRLAMILYRSHPTFFCFPDRISPEFEFKNLVLLTPSTFFFSFCGINPRTRRMIVTTNYNAHTLALCGSE